MKSDHERHKLIRQVMGEILYPGAGMLVMAIEAINQVHRGQDIEGFKIKDTAILAPLSIPQDDIGVEIQFRLKLSQDASSKTSAWAGFALYTCHNDSYTEVCRGYVRAVIANELASEFNEQLDLDSRQMADLIRLANLQYDQGMAPSQLYERALKNGYYYGRAFQKIESAKRNKQGELIGLVGVDTIPGLSTHQTPAVIHPGSLDSMFQLMLLAVAEDGDDGQPSTWIPTYVPNMHLSRLGLLNTENREQVHVHVSTRLMSSRLSTTDMYVLGSDGGSLLLKTEGFEMTSISDNMGDADADTKAHIKRLCYDLEYKPDPTLISMADIAYYTQESPDEFSAESRDVMGDIALSALSKALSSISEDQVAPVAHLRKHYKWLKSIMSGPRMPNANLKAPPGSKNSPSRLDQVVDGAVRALSDELRSSRHIGGFFMRLGDNLDDLLYGNATLPEVLNLGGNSTDIFSVLGNVIPSPSGLLSYLDLTAHKNPSMKILEVGAGTFSITKQIIDTLSSQTLNGTLYRFSHYDAAHILSDVVESNRESFDSITKMNFSQLDLTSPDAASKYEQNSYDLIVATNVVAGATASLAESLAHVRWDDELRQAGFTGTDLMLPDKTPDDTRLPSIIISSAAWSAEEPRTISRANDANGQLIAITGFRGRSKSPLAEAIFSSLSSVGVQEKTFHEGAALKDIGTRPVIIIQDQHWPEISSLDEADYTAFHAILSRSGAIHWLSDTSQYVNKVSDLGIIRGLARTLRMEKQNSIFVTTAIDSSRREALPLSLESSMNNFFSGVQNKRFEPELVQINDMLCIPRLYENNQLNQKVHGFTAKKIQTMQRFGEHNVKLAIQQTGLLDTLYFEQISSIEELAPTEIEVAVKAIGVTFKDCLVALGRVPEDTMGTECAGIVVKSGRDSRFRVGDHVLVQKMDSFRGRLRCHERLAAKIPKGMSFTDAAASVTNFVTAYHCLVGIANLQPGETVLIHSGAGGTGQAAIQIAQQRGATVFTTTSSSEKRALLSREYGIPAEHVFNSRNIAFSQGIKRLTKGRGVDVVLNSLAGESLVASWECIAPYGRFIEIGKRDIFSHNDLPMYQFARNVSFSAVDIGAMTVDRPEAIGKILDTLVGLFESDKLRVTSPVKTFPVTDVQSAFRHLQTGLNPGTVAVDIDWATVIPVTATAAYDSVFDANATYIIAGGLGGQGRSIAKWMATRGARNLVLLSRSGPRSEEAAHFVDELRSEGIVVYCPRCSIADVESVCNVMRYCQENMPPIKGCIQAAMDLRDGVFENMSVDAWNGCLAAKIAGSWNLHEQLPRNLDFFILFSSVSGLIGSQGQANYAAGNTYQDELAQFRLDRGEKAVSLNLGPLEDAGFVAENLGMAERLINMRSVMMLSQEEVFALLDYYCNPDLPVSSIGAQLVTGLDVPADVLARGMEPSDWVNQPLFANLHQVPASAAAGSARTGAQTEQDLFAQVRDTESLTEAGDLLANGLAGKMCKVLSIPLETFDIDQPLHTYGVDSLIALEIRNWFLKALKVDVAVFEILGGSSARSLGHTVVKKIRAV
ncbi:polyketide synthase [Pestalotiopsis sp. 9143b]|nr:polyketide synthase [Pestalotiopsis sp. 9143b]